MAFNLDTVNGGDSHKRWDVYPPPGEDPVDYVLNLARNPGETDKACATRILSWASAKNGMPRDLQRGLQRIAAGLAPKKTTEVGDS